MLERLYLNKILIIPDGHRRYAHKHKIPYKKAYLKGAETAIKVVQSCLLHQIVGHLTLFPLAKKNFIERDPETMSIIMEALKLFIDEMRKHTKDEIQFNYRGSLNRLPNEISESINDLIYKTEKNKKGMRLELLIDYDGIENLKSLNKNQVEKILNKPFEIIIRTGGAFRLSGAPSLECLNADMFSLPATFPEITYDDIKNTILSYLGEKERRYKLRYNL